MADYCVCCGKKLGVFFGEHLNKTVCDKCFFRFSGYLDEMENVDTVTEVENVYMTVRNIIEESDFLDAGKEHLIAYADEMKQRRSEKIASKDAEIAFLNEEQEKKRIQEEQAKKDYFESKKNFLITTGYNFEGYKIEKYLGVGSTSVVMGTGIISELSAGFNDIFGQESNTMATKIDSAKEKATLDLIEKCLKASGNAILGVDYDIMTLAGNMIVVSANGTFVKICTGDIELDF